MHHQPFLNRSATVDVIQTQCFLKLPPCLPHLVLNDPAWFSALCQSHYKQKGNEMWRNVAPCRGQYFPIGGKNKTLQDLGDHSEGWCTWITREKVSSLALTGENYSYGFNFIFIYLRDIHFCLLLQNFSSYVLLAVDFWKRFALHFWKPRRILYLLEIIKDHQKQ